MLTMPSQSKRFRDSGKINSRIYRIRSIPAALSANQYARRLSSARIEAQWNLGIARIPNRNQTPARNRILIDWKAPAIPSIHIP